jgi:signal transduction histidine kinase
LDAGVTTHPFARQRPALLLPRRAVLGGVSAALAAHLGWRVTVVRALFVALTIAGGAGALFYLWLWALVPTARAGDDSDAVTRRIPVAAVLVTVAALAVLIGVEALGAGADTRATQALIVVTIAAGGAVVWILGFDRSDPTRSRRYEVIVRTSAVLLLLVAGVFALSTRPNALNAILGVVMVVTAVAVLVAPNVVTLWTDLMAERAARVRQQQRAEIAAHLHDSVLQTLALIQNRAGASSEVARIARAQERELRDWLFAGDDPVAADLATELRGVAAAIELDYAVRIDLVAVGESIELAGTALVAAAREAMLNAARHAGGEVSVYLETSPGAVDVFIRDRGPGVDLDALPADRLGIRESIIGRMTRAGGTATVRPGAGGTAGTEVHLHLEVPND